MKKHIIRSITFAMALALPLSCDYLDKVPEDQLTMDMVFQDKIRTEDWLAAVYQGVPDPLWGYFQREGYNIMGDDINIPPEWTPYGWNNVYQYVIGSWNPTSGWPADQWNDYPKKIRNALIFIERAQPLEAAGLAASTVERMKWECRFLIGYYYSLMIRSYGPVPFNPTKITPTDASAEELMLPQTPFDEIVDWIDTEMQEVAQHLPAAYETDADWGRATAVSAMAVRANTLLFAASPLCNGNPDFKNWVDKEGRHLMSPTYDATKWDRAAKAFRELLALCQSNGYDLYKEYNDDGSIDPFMSCYNLSLKRFNEGNHEILFGRSSVPSKGSGLAHMNNFLKHQLPKSIGGNAGMGVTQELVDAFYTKDGVAPVLGYDGDHKPLLNPAAALYSEKGFSGSDEVRNTKWPGGGGKGRITLKGTYNMYVNREPRFYVAVIFNRSWLSVVGRQADFYLGGADTETGFDSPKNGYNIRKRIPLETNPKENVYPGSQPGILYRLADAYLGYAESLNESKPGDPDILKYINLVRERAGIPAAAGGTQDEIRELIRHERRVELCCEGIRFHDLRRWKLAEKYLNLPYMGMNHDGKVASDDPAVPNAYYMRTYIKSRTFYKKMYLFPVPQNEMDNNPNLVQNPGYVSQ